MREQEITRTTLLDYRRLLSRRSRHAPWPFVLSAGVYHRKRTLHGLMYCPRCLRQTDSYFRRIWRLAFLVQCPDCNQGLLDACPQCDAPIVPHRTANRVYLCHACSADLRRAKRPTSTEASPRVSRMQDLLSNAAQKKKVQWLGQQLSSSEAFRTTKILLQATAARYLQAYRGALGLSLESSQEISSRQFEHQRVVERIVRLETIDRLTEDWPRTFLRCVMELGLTQRRFSEFQLPKSLAEQVRRLPPGTRLGPRPQQPVLGTQITGLKKRSLSKYRQARARRLLDAADDP